MLLGRLPLILVVGASFLWGSVAQRRVKPFGIVAELDVACHVFAGVFTRWVYSAVHALDLQRRIERFRLRVIKTRSYPPHRMTKVELIDDLGERLAEILRASIGVEIAADCRQ